jgi:CRISPR-associated protein (Cas_Csd1)
MRRCSSPRFWRLLRRSVRQIPPCPISTGRSEGKDGSTRPEAFRDRYRRELARTKDEGLLALLRFGDAWRPVDFERLGWFDEMKDQNIVFALESERRQDIRIHDRPAARELWAKLSAGPDKVEAACLVTGARGPVARLHPSIKGAWARRRPVPRSYLSTLMPSPPMATNRGTTRPFPRRPPLPIRQLSTASSKRQ